nr:MAG TPA: hypothetical protein [Caudoviricetes sp.]
MSMLLSPQACYYRPRNEVLSYRRRIKRKCNACGVKGCNPLSPAGAKSPAELNIFFCLLLRRKFGGKKWRSIHSTESMTI